MSTAKVTSDSPDDGARIHPPIRSLLDVLTFRLARLVAVNDRMGTQVFRDIYGLSLNEWRVLGLASALEPATINAIRKVLLMDKGQISRIVRQMTDDGLLRSQTAASDARSVEVALTDRGRALHENVLVFTADRNEVVVGNLTPEECREFMRILQKITVHNEMLSELSGLLK